MNKKKLILISILSLILLLVSFKLDNVISNNISQLWNPILNNIMIIISYLFDSINIILASLIMSIILFYKKKKQQALFLLSTTILGAVLVIIIKEIVQRARPINQLVLESSYSFPSGHVVLSTVFFISLFLILKNKLKYLLILVIIFIGFNRIYLNVHWFSDVIAGFFLGLIIVILGKSVSTKLFCDIPII